MSSWIYFNKHTFVFLIILKKSEGTGHWNLPWWKTRIHFNCIVNIMTADVLETEGARWSASMVLTWFSQNISVSVPEGLIWFNWMSCIWHNTMGCHYNAVNFHPNSYKRHLIARPLGRGMGCLLWIQHLINILPEFMQSFMQYLTILDRVLTTLNCI